MGCSQSHCTELDGNLANCSCDNCDGSKNTNLIHMRSDGPGTDNDEAEDGGEFPIQQEALVPSLALAQQPSFAPAATYLRDGSVEVLRTALGPPCTVHSRGLRGTASFAPQSSWQNLPSCQRGVASRAPKNHAGFIPRIVHAQTPGSPRMDQQALARPPMGQPAAIPRQVMPQEFPHLSSTIDTVLDYAPEANARRAALEEAGRAAANAAMRGGSRISSERNAETIPDMSGRTDSEQGDAGHTYESVTTLLGTNVGFAPVDLDPEPSVQLTPRGKDRAVQGVALDDLSNTETSLGKSRVITNSVNVPLVFMSSRPASVVHNRTPGSATISDFG